MPVIACVFDAYGTFLDIAAGPPVDRLPDRPAHVVQGPDHVPDPIDR